MAFINIVRFPMNLLAQAMKLLYDSSVSLTRLEKFMFLDTIPESLALTGPEVSKRGKVQLSNCSFVWGCGGTESEVSAIAVQDVSLNIGPTELVAVVGAVGSGKTALISSILGELNQTKGRPPETSGAKAYMAQTPWIQGLTLKANVLFGRIFAEASADGSFDAALNAACLLPDLDVLPAREEVRTLHIWGVMVHNFEMLIHFMQTEIGERGFNLSGGQKARVAFARCLCHHAAAQIFLFDDPFSAVDSGTGTMAKFLPLAVHTRALILKRELMSIQMSLKQKYSATGAAMFKRGIQGVLANTLRVVTLNSHLNLLPNFDRILVVQDGRIAFDGPYSSLAGSFPQYTSVSSEGPSDLSDDGNRSSAATKDSKHVVTSAEVSNGKLARTEAKAIGGVKSSVYFSYISAGQSGKAGAIGLFALVFLFVLAQSARVYADIAGARWAELKGNVHTWNLPVATYLTGVLITIVLLVIRTSLLNLFAIHSSKELHNIVLKCVIKVNL